LQYEPEQALPCDRAHDRLLSVLASSVAQPPAPHERAVLATLIWSAEEAALPALREGLRLDTREVEVTPARVREPGQERHRSD
jgi:hypothetical protein